MLKILRNAAEIFLQQFTITLERFGDRARGMHAGAQSMADPHRRERVEGSRGIAHRDPVLAACRAQALRSRGTHEQCLWECPARGAGARVSGRRKQFPPAPEVLRTKVTDDFGIAHEGYGHPLSRQAG